MGEGWEEVAGFRGRLLFHVIAAVEGMSVESLVSWDISGHIRGVADDGNVHETWPVWKRLREGYVRI